MPKKENEISAKDQAMFDIRDHLSTLKDLSISDRTMAIQIDNSMLKTMNDLVTHLNTLEKRIISIESRFEKFESRLEKLEGEKLG